jgi:hypothetical protein
VQQAASYILEFEGILDYSVGDQIQNHTNDSKGDHYINGCPIVTKIEFAFTPNYQKTYLHIKDYFPQP